MDMGLGLGIAMNCRVSYLKLLESKPNVFLTSIKIYTRISNKKNLRVIKKGKLCRRF